MNMDKIILVPQRGALLTLNIYNHDYDQQDYDTLLSTTTLRSGRNTQVITVTFIHYRYL